MLIKLILSMMIIGCTSKISFDYAATFSRRIAEIQHFSQGLKALEREISFCLTPLNEALKNAGINLLAQVKKVFCEAGENLDKYRGITARDAWQGAITNNQNSLALKQNDINILLSLGNMLGAGDLSSQIINIELALSKLLIMEQVAKSEEEKYAKMYRNLGVLCGIFIALIFI